MARFLTRVRLENYKSIAHCDVELQDLTFLVGPNGAGKSNFLDSMLFVSESVRDSLSKVISDKGGIESIQKVNTFNPIILNLFSEECEYYVKIKKNEDEYEVIYEELKSDKNGFEVYENKSKNLNLFSVAKDNVFTDKIVNIYMYMLIPDHYWRPEFSMKQPKMDWDGENISGILFFLQKNEMDVLNRINVYMKKIIPELNRVWVLQAGGYDILQFDVDGSDIPFNASQMSDGTLYALGVLTAIFHAKSAGISLIGIEEPEAGLHPAAARVLYDALAEASQDVQIIVTSHSPDLLDNPDISPDSILAVVRENGETKIGPIDDVSRQVLNEHMFTAGELLRLNQLQPKQ